MNKNSNFKFGLALFISISAPFLLNTYFANQTGINIGFGLLGLWVLVNYLFVSITIELISDIINVLKLKGVKIKILSYIMTILIYSIFTIYMNAYLVQISFSPDNIWINTISKFEVLLVLLVAFIANLFCGILPNKSETENTNVYTFSNKGPIKYGRDSLATLVGYYDKGIILGSLPVDFDTMKSIYKDKENNLVIKGKGADGNYRISVSESKTSAELMSILKKSVEKEKIKSNIINV